MSKQEERNYREGVRQDIEGVATRARTMTGKKASSLSNQQIRQANREHDAMDRREAKHYVNGKQTKRAP